MIKFGLILLFLISVQAYGQVWDWARIGTGPGMDINSAVVAENGNYFVTGYFEDTLTLGMFTLYAVGHPESYIASYSTNGQIQWAINSKSLNSFGEVYSGNICSDQYGNLFVLGSFNGQIIYGGITLTNYAINSMFLLKLDNTGTVIWAKKAGNAYGAGIGTDNSGNVYITGSFTSLAMFDADTLTNMGGKDIFLTKYDALGNNLWVKQAGGSYSERPYALSVDSVGNCHITGSFSEMSPTGSSSFDNINIFTKGWEDIFIAKYDTYGNALWAKSAGSVGMDETGRDIATDKQGYIYLSGRISGTTTFGNDTLYITQLGSNDMFIAKFDPSGTAIWGKNTKSRNAGPGPLCVDEYSNCYVTGWFKDSAFYNSVPIYTSYNTESFITKFDEQGTLIWAKEFGGKGAQWGLQDIDLDQNNNLVFAGGYTDTANFGPIIIYPVDPFDCYISKMNLPAPIGIVNISYDLDWFIAPNPTTNYFTIEGMNKSYNLSIYNSLGQVLYNEKNVNEASKRVDVSMFNRGLFFVRIESDGELITKKIIKE